LTFKNESLYYEIVELIELIRIYEMVERLFYTTSEAATICRVDYRTINRWIKNDKLKASKTLGGHYRILREDLQKFLTENNMPLPEDLDLPLYRILIVDDEKDTLKLFKSILIAHNPNFTIETASDGFEAGQFVGSFSPDLILLDLFMPGLDGFQVCKIIKGNPKTTSIKILVITGFYEEMNINKSLEMGADMCIAKPIPAKKLCEVVDDILFNKNK